MPQTRWWRCTPLSLTTLPGHQVKRGLRLSRALRRMKAKEPRKATSTRNRAWRWWSTSWSCQKLDRIEAEGSIVTNRCASCCTGDPSLSDLRPRFQCPTTYFEEPTRHGQGTGKGRQGAGEGRQGPRVGAEQRTRADRARVRAGLHHEDGRRRRTGAGRRDT